MGQGRVLHSCMDTMPPPSLSARTIGLARPSLIVRIIGWLLAAPPVGMLLMSASTKFIQPAWMEKAMEPIGWTMDKMIPLGIIEVLCTVLYLVPRTNVLGAILLTGYLGGAIATHVRIGEYGAMQVAMGVMLWVSLALREPQIWSFAKFKSP